MSQVAENKEKTENTKSGTLTSQFRFAGILATLRQQEGADALLRFAAATDIKMMFDATLPDPLPAMTLIRESRMPQNLETGTVILLNPRAADAALATAVLEKLHFCRMARQTVAPSGAPSLRSV